MALRTDRGAALGDGRPPAVRLRVPRVLPRVRGAPARLAQDAHVRGRDLAPRVRRRVQLDAQRLPVRPVPLLRRDAHARAVDLERAVLGLAVVRVPLLLLARARGGAALARRGARPRLLARAPPPGGAAARRRAHDAARRRHRSRRAAGREVVPRADLRVPGARVLLRRDGGELRGLVRRRRGEPVAVPALPRDRSVVPRAARDRRTRAFAWGDPRRVRGGLRLQPGGDDRDRRPPARGGERGGDRGHARPRSRSRLRVGRRGRARRRLRRDARGGCRLPARHRRRGGERARGAPHRRRAGARRFRAPGPARARDRGPRSSCRRGFAGALSPRSRGGRARHRARGAPARGRRRRGGRAPGGAPPARARRTRGGARVRLGRDLRRGRAGCPRRPPPTWSRRRSRRCAARRACRSRSCASSPTRPPRRSRRSPAISPLRCRRGGSIAAAAVARAIVAAVRSPIRTATFVRASLGWCHRLRGAWREAGASVAAGSAERAGERQRSAN